MKFPHLGEKHLTALYRTPHPLVLIIITNIVTYLLTDGVDDDNDDDDDGIQSRRSRLRPVLPHSGQRSAVTSLYGVTPPDIPSRSCIGRVRTAAGACQTEPISSGSVAADIMFVK